MDRYSRRVTFETRSATICSNGELEFTRDIDNLDYILSARRSNLDLVG